MGTEDHDHPEGSGSGETQPDTEGSLPGTVDAPGEDEAGQRATGAEDGAAAETDAEQGTGESGDDTGAGDIAAGDADGNASVKRVLEAALLVAGRPLSMNDFEKLFGGSPDAPPRNRIRSALAELGSDWQGRSLELQEVATGYRAQVRNEFEPWIARLWDEKPPRYSRALLETLAIIAYRQPMTRSEIEDIRGVSVSTQIIRTLTEREWIRVVGHREAPGRPAMYGTTREFLDYFNLKTLDQLPPISDIKDLEGQYPELGFEAEPAGGGGSKTATGESSSADTTDQAPDGSSAVGSEAADSDAAAAPTGPDESGDASGTNDRVPDDSATDTRHDEPSADSPGDDASVAAGPDSDAPDTDDGSGDHQTGET